MSQRVAAALAAIIATLTLGAVVPATASAAPATPAPADVSAVTQATPTQWLAICLNVPLGSVSISFCI